MVTYCLTKHVREIRAVGFFGSLEYTAALFVTLPFLLLVFNFRVIFPSCPGGIALSKSATVQPHPGFTFLILSTAVPVFLTEKEWVTISPSYTSPASWVVFLKEIVGCSSEVCSGVFSTTFFFFTVALINPSSALTGTNDNEVARKHIIINKLKHVVDLLSIVMFSSLG
jgi:hypothetical protein